MWNKKFAYKVFFLIQLLALPFAGRVLADEAYLYRPTTGFSPEVFSGAADSNSGAYVYNYDIYFPEGRNGIQPNFKLQYNNQDTDQANIAGYGWSISLPYINRISKKGVDNLYPDDIGGSWNPDDYYFYSSLSGEILPVDPTTTTERIYGAKVETGGFLSYEFANNSWVVTDKLGTTYTFGSATSTRQDDSLSTGHVYKWMLEEVRDTNDNYIKYSYYKDDGTIYPSSTIYTGHGSTDGIYEVVFTRESRNDTPILYNTGFAVQPNYRISEIQVKVNGVWVRKYELDYTTGNNGKRSLLQTITESGNNGSVLTMPVTTFTYQAKTQGFASSTTWGPQWEHGTPPDECSAGTLEDKRALDYNGDGLMDIVSAGPSNSCSSGNETEINNGNNSFTLNTGISLPELARISPGKDNGIRFDDLDGDGYMDVVQANIFVPASGPDQEYSDVYLNDRDGSGWTASSTYDFPYQFIKHYENYSGKADDTFTRLADVNNDGFADILKDSVTSSDKWVYLNSRAGGFGANSGYSVPFELGSYETQPNEVVFLDVNGDDLNDIVSVGHDTIYVEGPGNQRYPTVSVCLNKDGGENYDCSGFVINTTSTPAGYEKAVTDYDNGTKFMDVNGDGLIDLIRNSPVSYALYDGIYINKGDGTGWAYDANQQAPLDFAYDIGGGTWRDSGVFVMDANGDGLSDFVGTNGSGDVYLNNGKKSDVLIEVDNSSGASTEVVYQTAQLYRDSSGNKQANPVLPLIVHTAKNIVTDDGLGNITTTTYQYGGGGYYFNTAFDRRFAGFRITTTTDAIGNITVQYFHQGDSTDTGYLERNDDGSKINMMYREDIRDSSGNLYKQTLNKYNNTDLGNNRDFVYLTEKLVRDFDGDSDSKDSAQSFEYNNGNGNLTKQINWGDVSVTSSPNFSDTASDKLIDEYAYATDGGNLVGLVSRQTTLDNSSSTVRQVINYYDNLSFGSASDGNKTKEAGWVTSTAYIDIENTYNSYGLVTTSTDANDNQTEFTYDTYNLYVTTSTNALNQETLYAYNYAFGKPTQITDANGQVRKTLYDQIGRVTGERIPDIDGSAGDTVSSTDRIYTDNTAPRKVHTVNYLNSATTTDAYVYLDGFDKKIQEKTEAENGNFSVKDYSYNFLRLLDAESLPYFSSSSANTTATTTSDLYTNYAYDALSRVLSINNVTGTTTNAYDQWTVTTTDALGNIKTYSNDAFGRLIRVSERNDAESYYTYYEYNGNNKLTKITDDLSNIRNFQYDGLGRRTIAEDLHVPGDSYFGIWNYAYDNNGNLATSTDAESQTTNYTYDELNRVETENYTGESGTEITYLYDGCTNGIGKLCSVVMDSASTTLSYDALGNVATELKTVSSTDYQTEFEYDRQGNTTLIKYPDNSEVKYLYNSAGQLESVLKKENGESVFSSITDNFNYSPLGQIEVQENANGTVTANTYNADELYRLQNRTTEQTNSLSAPGDNRVRANILQDIDYTYDSVGNIIGTVENSDLNINKTMGYNYDDLYRLLSAYTTAVTSTSPGSYTRSYTYDAIGNILSKDNTTTTTPSTVQKSIDLEKDSSQYLSITDASQTGLDLTSDFTIEMWVKPESYVNDAGSNNFLISKYAYQTGNSSYSTSIISNSGSRYARVFLSSNGSNEYYCDSSSLGVSTGTWFHLKYQYTASSHTVAFFVDGTAKGTCDITATSIYNSTVNFRIGREDSSYFDGLIDDVRIYNAIVNDDYETELTGTEDNLVGYWNLNDHLFDETASHNDLTNNNSVLFSTDAPFEGGTTSTPPIGQKSIDLEKDSSQYLSITDASQTGLDLNSDFTIELWVKPESYVNDAGSNNFLISKYAYQTGNSSYSTSIISNSGSRYARVFLSSNGSNEYYCDSSSLGVSTGNWFNLKYQYTASSHTVAFFVDGTAKGTCDITATSIYNSTVNFRIGKEDGSYFDGLIDDVRIYNAIVNDDYETELTGNETNLVGYWQLNDDALDETSNNNDLTNNNSALFSTDVPFTETTSSTSPTSTYYLYEGNTGTSFANPHALTTVSTTTSTVDYVYDNNGNLVSYGDWSNVWDYMNRLLQSVNSTEGTTTTYSYDQSGQRVKKIENGVVSVYPNKYYTIENGVVKKHIFAGDTELASIEGTTTTYHHVDHLSGSSVETDEEGYVTEVLDYYPFGETRLDEKYTTYENDKKFTGHMYDDATGLYYMGARYQDPEIGRFVSEDTASLHNPSQFLSDPQQLNMYSYARNNPILFRDPTGNCIEDACILETAIGLGMAYGPSIVARIAPYAQTAYNASIAYLAAKGILGHDQEALDQAGMLMTVDIGMSNPAVEAGQVESSVGNKSGNIGVVESKNVSNPYGKKGGPAHQAVQNAKFEELRSKGYQSVEKEIKINTPLGQKVSRYADVGGTNPNTLIQEYYQVGRSLKDGYTPVSRERSAISDIRQAQPQSKVEFLPYNK